MSMPRYSRLKNDEAAFSDMLARFGVVTVMNAKVYDIPDNYDFKSKDADDVAADFSSVQYQADYLRCELDTLKVANVTQEGPTKTVTGGQYSNPLIKYGKTARLEMQDALGNAEAVEALCGGRVEYKDNALKTRIALHVGSDFEGQKLIMGDSFFIDQKSGQQIPVTIIFYQFLPDSIFNLTQDASGDATVFDMNGDLLTTDIKMGNREGQAVVHGAFYSIIEKVSSSDVSSLYSLETDETDNSFVITIESGYSATLDGVTVDNDHKSIDAGTAALLVIKDNQNNIVLSTTIVNNNAPVENAGE